jgi:hypothetical protein
LVLLEKFYSLFYFHGLPPVTEFDVFWAPIRSTEDLMQEPSANSVYHHLFLLVSDVQLIGEVDEQKARQK